MSDFHEATAFHPRNTTNYSGDDLYPLRINTGVKGNISGRRGQRAAGTYTDTGRYDRGEIQAAASSFNDEHQAGHTLIHELGHYKSAKVEHNDSANYNTPTQRGKEEAVADDNMVERFRPDPRDVRKGAKPRTPAYETVDSFHGMGGQKAHRPYTRARKTLASEDKESMLKYGFKTKEYRPSTKVAMFYGKSESEGGGWRMNRNAVVNPSQFDLD